MRKKNRFENIQNLTFRSTNSNYTCFCCFVVLYLFFLVHVFQFTPILGKIEVAKDESNGSHQLTCARGQNNHFRSNLF